MSTVSIPEHKITPKWFLVDAQDVPLGRLASTVAFRLRGKHKPIYTPHVNCGDHIIVINAEKVKVTGKKVDQKIYYYHTGFPGGLKSPNFKEMLSRAPHRIVELAVKGMLPKGTLGRDINRKLKVYAGSEHPHISQQPEILTIK